MHSVQEGHQGCLFMKVGISCRDSRSEGESSLAFFALSKSLASLPCASVL